MTQAPGYTLKRLCSYWPLFVALFLTQPVQATSYNLSFFSGPVGFRILDSGGINNEGDIVGWGFNDTGGPTSFFRSSGGHISTFGIPNSSLTQANAINDSGQIVGDYYDFTGIHGFLRQSDGSIQTLHLPYSSFGFSAPYSETVRATGINDAGQIIGTFQAAQSNGNVVSGSFLEQPNGSFIAIDPMNQTSVASISNDGFILGTEYVNGTLTHSVMNSSLQIVRTITDVPSAYGYGGATLNSINSGGDIVGSFDSNYGAFITNVSSDVYLSLPSPRYCTAGAINDSGVIAGTCGMSYQGFVLAPTADIVPEPASAQMLLWALMMGRL